MESLSRAASLAPAALAEAHFGGFAQLHGQRLWHELTLALQTYFRAAGADASLPALYADFLCGVQPRIKQLSFAKMAVAAAAAAAAAGDVSAALALLEDAAARVRGAPARAADEAERVAVDVLLGVAAGALALRGGDVAAARAAVSKASAVPGGIEALFAVDAAVPALYYGVSAAIDKASASFSAYYRSALLYLSAAEAAGPVALADLGAAGAPHAGSDAERAHDLCVAALLGDATYNFGELLMHPVLGALAGTPYAYLADAVRALNAGNHEAFAAHADSLAAHPTIAPRMAFLREKMSLMALVDAAFRQLRVAGPSGRALSFGAVAAAAGVPPDQAELMLIRALSVRLLRGAVDEPRGVFRVDWVLPRVLDAAQVDELRGAVASWRARVQQTAGMF